MTSTARLQQLSNRTGRGSRGSTPPPPRTPILSPSPSPSSSRCSSPGPERAEAIRAQRLGFGAQLLNAVSAAATHQHSRRRGNGHVSSSALPPLPIASSPPSLSSPPATPAISHRPTSPVPRSRFVSPPSEPGAGNTTAAAEAAAPTSSDSAAASSSLLPSGRIGRRDFLKFGGKIALAAASIAADQLEDSSDSESESEAEADGEEGEGEGVTRRKESKRPFLSLSPQAQAQFLGPLKHLEAPRQLKEGAETLHDTFEALDDLKDIHEGISGLRRVSSAPTPVQLLGSAAAPASSKVLGGAGAGLIGELRRRLETRGASKDEEEAAADIPGPAAPLVGMLTKAPTLRRDVVLPSLSNLFDNFNGDGEGSRSHSFAYADA